MNSQPALALTVLTLWGSLLPAHADLTNGLVAYYNFENLKGQVGETIVDRSGHGHDGICRQDQNTLKAPTIVAGPNGLGSALSFDGSFYVQIPNHSDFNVSNAVTLAAWVAVDSFDQDWQTMFCRGDWSWRLHRSGSSDYAAFHMSGLTSGYGADGQTTNLRVPKRWLHLVGTYTNGAAANLYVNGALETANTGVSGLVNTSGNDPVTIGAQIDNGVLRRQWRGQLDEVRLYNRALNPMEVVQLYDPGATTITNTNTNFHAQGYQYLSPLPQAEYCSPQTRLVLVRFQNVSPTALTNLATFIQVTGSQSARHPGQTKIALDGRTVLYQMSSDFIANETVTVALTPGVPPAAGGPVPAFQYQFMISGHFADGTSLAAPAVTPEAITSSDGSGGVVANGLLQAAKGVAGIMPNGVSVPSDFPWITITTSNNPDPDPIFIDNRGGGGKPYNVIFDNSGSPLWYQRMPDERRDMKVQHNGVMTMLARDGGNHFNGFDTHYRQVTNYWAVNGYGVDEHELQVLADGTYLLVGLRTETVDMSRFVIGGNTAAYVTEQVIQEFTPAGELILQWRAWDHFDIHDQQQFINLTGSSFDFPHMNAIDIDTDGNILLSSRSTSEITKINRDTGEIMWRFGGAHNQFTFLNDPLAGPRQQHAIRMVGTNHYTLFDNGNLHSPSVSRAVEYALDPTNMTATIVWQYPNPTTTSLYSFYMGNAQRLTNGNTLINWAVGNLPKLTEVRPDGTKAFEMNWADGWEAYRVWRCPWQGAATQPYLIVEPYPDNVTLIFNQFGDTNVAFYRIYGGTTSQSTNLLATSGVTLKQLTSLSNGTYYFRVTAVNRQGVEGPFSNEATATVNLIKPGQNMVANGDFSQGTASWTWTLSGGATASWAIENGVSHFYITNATTTLANIQLKQTGKAVIKGKKYVLEFDAWSAQPRYIEAKVAQAVSPYANYSGTPSIYITPVHNHYRYVFTMSAASDFNANVVFNVGSSTYGVYLDNVSLFNAPAGDLNLDGKVDLLDLQLLSRDWLKQQSGLGGDLDGSGKVDFNDLGVLGDNWSGGN